ncbi:HAD family hydrolase [Bacteroidetes/Chlorobi group bacterium MS-B_bin-24]|jgi:putative hydrolase of the HAD superfamily|nr:MAG: HAD family hydrolase [Bacteroidetes/Chlorobi group bacterium MS-B_bin-24]
MSKIKVVTIDFWNTLFDSSNGIERNEHRIKKLKSAFESIGLEISDSDYEKAMQDAWEYFNNIWRNEQRTISTRDAIQFFWNYFQAPVIEELIEDVVDTFEKSILVHPPTLIEGVPEALESLSKKFKLAIVSDTGFSPGSILRELLKISGIYDYFSYFSFSNETGVAKPHPKAFLSVLNHFDCEPQNALHIGDIEETDIQGAKNLQMFAIRFIGNHLDFLNEDSEVHTLADAIATSWKEIPQIIDEIDSNGHTESH